MGSLHWIYKMNRASAPIMLSAWLVLWFGSGRLEYLGAFVSLAVVVTVIEGNRLCDRLWNAPSGGDIDAMARAAGVLGPRAVEDIDLREVFATMDPAFRVLDADATVRSLGRQAQARERVNDMPARVRMEYARIVVALRRQGLGR